METLGSFLRALCRGHTYDLRRNRFAWFGFAWGLPIPIFSLALDHLLLDNFGHRSPFSILLEHPWHIYFLAHPFAFAVIFGAFGTLFEDLKTRNRELFERLQHEATTDSLTAASTRRFVLDELDRALARSERSTDPVAVILMDMDNFKEVNDTQGHLAGDRLLRQVADALRAALRRGDTLGRYGGDEFLIVAPGSREGAVSVAERARQAVLDRTGHTISAGIAASGENGRSASELIMAADADLAVKKRQHKTRRFGPPTAGPGTPRA
ncbi:MAG: GGDEF domain-containing protein [Planctomycetia bacterium]|nr:GGDEF domain-containing protein [Planctomycetia bacterium]